MELSIRLLIFETSKEKPKIKTNEMNKRVMTIYHLGKAYQVVESVAVKYKLKAFDSVVSRTLLDVVLKESLEELSIQLANKMNVNKKQS